MLERFENIGNGGIVCLLLPSLVPGPLFRSLATSHPLQLEVLGGGVDNFYILFQTLSFQIVEFRCIGLLTVVQVVVVFGEVVVEVDEFVELDAV